MIHKDEKKIGKTYCISRSYDLENKEAYNRFCEYQIIDNVKFEISKAFSKDMELNDISVKVVEVTGFEHMNGEYGYEIRCYLTNDQVDFIRRNINDGHTNQDTKILYGDDIFEALDYIMNNFEKYSDQLIISDEAMEIYSQLLKKTMVVEKYAI